MGCHGSQRVTGVIEQVLTRERADTVGAEPRRHLLADLLHRQPGDSGELQVGMLEHLPVRHVERDHCCVAHAQEQLSGGDSSVDAARCH